MSWKRILLAILIALTAVQIPAVVVVERHALWASAIHLLPTAALWLNYAYRYAPTFRLRVLLLLAHYSGRLTSVQLTARLSGSADLTADAIGITIRARYAGRLNTGNVKIIPAGPYTVVEMPGWSIRFTIDEPLEEELDLEDGDDEPRRDVTFTMPDTRNSIRSALTTLSSDVLPLFEMMCADLSLRPEATEFVIRFVDGPNPYLSAYLQNVDADSIDALKCVLYGDRQGTVVTIGKDRITLRAGSFNDLRNLAEKHLALQSLTPL